VQLSSIVSFGVFCDFRPTVRVFICQVCHALFASDAQVQQHLQTAHLAAAPSTTIADSMEQLELDDASEPTPKEKAAPNVSREHRIRFVRGLLGKFTEKSKDPNEAVAAHALVWKERMKYRLQELERAHANNEPDDSELSDVQRLEKVLGVPRTARAQSTSSSKTTGSAHAQIDAAIAGTAHARGEVVVKCDFSACSFEGSAVELGIHTRDAHGTALMVTSSGDKMVIQALTLMPQNAELVSQLREGPKPSECPLPGCGRVFISKHFMHLHMEEVHGMAACDEPRCAFATRSRAALMMHLALEHSLAPACCALCPTVAKNDIDMSHHLREAHPELNYHD
jgi:hypothetical protein